MKKLIIAAAVVCAAAASYASTVNWSSTTAPNFFDTATLSGNGDYTAGTPTMKSAGRTFAYTLTVTTASGDTVGKASGTVAYNFLSGAFQVNNIAIGKDESAIASGTTYNYLIEITTDLGNVGKVGNWDYKSATAETKLSGTFTGASGSSKLASGLPGTWTVAGAIQDTPEPTPEPTSAMLMLLGVAGLALRRKQK